MKKYKIGYTQGTFDSLHHGHINLLKKAKKMCDYLIVGVNTDKLVLDYKKTNTIIPVESRKFILESIKYVDKVVICETLDKIDKLEKYNFNAIFIGDDWKDNPRWIQTKVDLKEFKVDVVFIEYTKGISTTYIKENRSNKDND